MSHTYQSIFWDHFLRGQMDYFIWEQSVWRWKKKEFVFQSQSLSDQRFTPWHIFSLEPLNCKQYLDIICSALIRESYIGRQQRNVAHMRQGIVKMFLFKFQYPSGFVLPRGCWGWKSGSSSELGETENIWWLIFLILKSRGKRQRDIVCKGNNNA